MQCRGQRKDTNPFDPLSGVHELFLSSFETWRAPHAPAAMVGLSNPSDAGFVALLNRGSIRPAGACLRHILRSESPSSNHLLVVYFLQICCPSPPSEFPPRRRLPRL